MLFVFFLLNVYRNYVFLLNYDTIINSIIKINGGYVVKVFSKKLTILLLTVIFSMSFVLPSFAAGMKATSTKLILPPTSSPLDIQASAAFLVEVNTGKIVYEKNPDESLPVASMTKMMT